MKYDELLRPGTSNNGHDHRGDLALFKRLGFSWVIGEANAVVSLADPQPTRRSGRRTCSEVSEKLLRGSEVAATVKSPASFFLFIICIGCCLLSPSCIGDLW